jgi:hypothetical protein
LKQVDWSRAVTARRQEKQAAIEKHKIEKVYVVGKGSNRWQIREVIQKVGKKELAEREQLNRLKKESTASYESSNSRCSRKE